MLAVGAGPRIVKLLNVSTGEVRLGATGHTSEVLCIALSPCGAILASAGKDCSWHLWDVASGEHRLDVRGHDCQGACVCTMGEDGYFDAATSGCPVGGHSEAVQAIAVSPCGARVATGGWDTQVIMWDARTGAEQLQMLSHESVVGAVTFAPDGLRVASCSWDGAVFIWSATSGEVLVTLANSHINGGVAGEQFSVAFSPDGRKLACAGVLDINIWDTHSGELLCVLSGHTGAVHSVAFSPDGCSVASASSDFSVRIWDAESSEMRLCLQGHDYEGRCLCPGPRMVHWACPVEGHKQSVSSVAFSLDGKYLASGSNDGTCRMWDAGTGVLLRTLDMWAKVCMVAFGRDCVRDSRVRARQVAFAMGGHERLGEVSQVVSLDPGVVQIVLELAVGVND